MKKSVLALCFSSLMGVCHAQKKVEANFKMGYVHSTLKLVQGNYTETFDAKSSAYMSFGMEYFLAKRFSLLGELALAGLGGENLIINDQKSRLHLTTFSIPLGVKFYPIPQKFNVSTGVNVGFTMAALGEQDGQKVEFKNVHRSNHSYFVGGEYKFAKSFLAEIKYNIGLSNIAKAQGQTMKNNFFQIGVGYILGN